jgi:hypothetical protein
MSSNKILLCCDVDRTVLPNGHAPESPQARPLFEKITAREEITLAYVSGRDKRLLLEAIDEFHIPVPDFAIGDVGTTLYRIEHGTWREDNNWAEHIGEDWQGRQAMELHPLIEDIDALRLQEPEKQNRYKLSYYADPDIDKDGLLKIIHGRLEDAQIKANLIWSVDEVNHLGLLDVLPQRASKRHAIEFLMSLEGFDNEITVFAGDSGNDLPVLCSPIPAVLVHNAQPSVRDEAIAGARAHNAPGQLYLAEGDFFGLNGNYTAGVLEGLAHYQPQAREWIEQALNES